ncbi:MAG: methyl-accepting chemotaxis protein [Veillonellales bacterium]
MKMNLTTKMVAYFLLVVLVTSLGFAYTIWKVNDVEKLVTNSSNELPRLLQTNQINNNAGDEIANIQGYFITKDQQMLNDYKREADVNSQIEKKLIEASNSAEGKRLSAEVKTLDDKYSEIAERKFIPLVQAGKQEEAIQVMVSELVPAATALNNKVDEYQERRNKEITNDLNQALDNVGQARNASIFAAVFSAVLGILIGFFAARRIASPVNQLAVVSQKVANGDLTEQVNVTSQDEIGKLASSFNTMVTELKTLIKQVTENAEQVAASSEELTASSEQSAQAANQIATSITDVAKGAEEQLAASNDTSAVVEQLSASIQQVAANTNEVAGQSAQAADKAIEGNKAVDEAVNQMTSIEQTVTASAEVVTLLGERSKEIGQIVDTISGIAGQTNLLALNAAIEAARAGEQGRGFAVVAEEVRKLAEQSQEAAKQIASLISEIQGNTDKAVVAMNDGTKEVKLGAEVVNAAGQAFREIATLVTNVSGQVQEISTAIEQMAVGSQQIVESVKRIDNLSKKASGESQTVSAATEEQSASMEEIAASSQSLAKMAQNLQSAVSNFQV